MAQLFYASNRTADSYFWEAKRMLGADETLSPRHAFIRAVAGQPPRGYERVVLEQGEAPPAFMQSVQMVEAVRVAPRARLAAAHTHADVQGARLSRAVPCLAAAVKVERKPILAEGEFVWGHVLTTAGYPEGIPCSNLVARLVSLIDGRRIMRELLARLCAD